MEKQIREGLAGVSNVNGQLSSVVIAYEPVWAIGTGNNCSYDETMSSVLLIRKIISNLYNKVIASKIKIIYGGSVNSKNSELYLEEAGVDGLLVGGASLDAEDFINIIKSA